MGFIQQKFADNQGGLMVAFQDTESNQFYYAGDSVEDALKHFDMYIKDNIIYIKTDEEKALETIGVKTAQEATELRETIDTIVDDYTDEQALDSKILFPNWHDNTAYAVNDRVRYGGRLYKVLQAHTSQSDWTPTRAPSLFAQILTGEETGEPQEWQQPDSTNAYMYGDRVIYDNKIYESTIDFNVWAPDNYSQGWTLIEDLNPPSEDEDEDEEIPEWVQPDASNGYHIGDKIHYQGLIYQSLIDNNVWSPDAYPAGWQFVQ